MQSLLDGQETFDVSPAEVAWSAIRENLRRSCGARTFDGWLKPLEFTSFDQESGEVCLSAPSAFMADWVRTHFSERLQQAWRSMLPNVRIVTISGEAGLPVAELAISDSVPQDVVVADEAVAAKEEALPAGLEQKLSFENFVVGKANEVAYNAARAVAEGDKLTFNPLFLHGTTGVGKTHLMHAIGQEFLSRKADAKIIYMSAEKFMVEFIAAMRAKDTFSFKQRLRAADLLMVDDVQFIAGKESTQEEFFHTLNELISAGKRIVITADRSPQDLEGIESRIVSRFSGGLVADVNAADFELRLSILLKKLETISGVDVPYEVVEFLARRISSNVRELEGALNRVVAYAMLSSKKVDLDFAQATLAEVLRANQRRITIDEIQRRVSEHYRIRQSEMSSARRSREVARPRQIAMYLAKQLTPRSLPEIGRKFGGRDHTTVIHAVRKIEELRQSDAEIDADVRLLIRQLES